MMGRLSEAGSFQRTLRAVGSLPPLVPAYGLYGKCSNQTGFLVRSSSRAQQSDSPDAHFLSGAEKCCVFLLVAHFHVFGFRSRPARRSVSPAQFSVSRKWLLAYLGSSGQCYRTSVSGPEARGDCPSRTFCVSASRLSSSLRCPGTRLTGGVHRRSGVFLLVLHRRNSTGIPYLLWTSYRGRIDRVTQHVCGSRVSAPAHLGDWLFDGPSPLGRNFRLLHRCYFLLAREGCGRHCATLKVKGSGNISVPHRGT